MKYALKYLVSIIIFYVLMGSVAEAEKSRMIDDQVLIKFIVGVDDVLARAHIANAGGSVIKVIPGINVYWVKIEDGETVEETIAEFKANPDCEYAEPNFMGGGNGPVPKVDKS